MSHRIPHHQRPHLHTQSEAKSSFDDVRPTPSTPSIPVTRSKIQNHKGGAMQKHEDRAVQCQRTTASTQASFSQKQFYSSCTSQSRISQDHSCRVHRDAFKGKYHSVWLKQRLKLPKRELHCPPNIVDYRNGYPGLKDDKTKNANYEFYSGKSVFQPRGVLIDVLLHNWKGKYNILESRHDYIQWIFPTRDGSKFNYHAQPLQKHEIEAICANPEALDRVLRSYMMMLDFYGMKLNQYTGEVERSDNHSIQRLTFLNSSSHNHMRITRILKSLGELNYEHLKAPFVRFVLHEAIVEGTLENTLNSCMKYWVETIREESERDSLWLLAENLIAKYY